MIDLSPVFIGVVYQPSLMVEDENDPHETKIFTYKYHSDALWDPNFDDYQYEHNFQIKTHKRGTFPSISSSTRVELHGGDGSHLGEDASDSADGGLHVRVVKQPSKERVDR